MNYFRWIEPGARGRRGSHRATPGDARGEAVRRVAGDAESNAALAAQVWRSLAGGGWRIEEIDASGRHVGWVEDAR